MLQKKSQHSFQETPHQGLPPMDTSGPAISFFEFWGRWQFYPPVMLYVLYLGLRHGGLTTFTAANPKITSGGFVGDKKTEMYDLFPDSLQKYLPKTVICAGNMPIEQITQRLEEQNLPFPVVAKPDMGYRGAGVQKLHSTDELKNYIESFPAEDSILFQEPIDYEAEAGVFYIRHPDQEEGEIFSLVLKYFPYVYGDGQSTLEELIKNDRRAGQLLDIYLPRHADKLDMILAKRESYRLSFAGAHSKGTIFKDGRAHITEPMRKLFDTISKQIPEFYFGRYDVRFKNMRSLETGEDLKIIELNGGASEATHIWDSNMRLTDAYKDLFAQFKHLFEIGAKNKKRGFKPMTIKEVWHLIQQNELQTEQYPDTH